jgi:hypothetical protein
VSENVTVFGDLADKYDALVVHDERLLDSYVEQSGYSLSSMVLASTAIAFMHFAQTFTDMGRLGNGVLIEGGVKGVGEDVLRALNLVGTVGAVAGRASTLLKVVQGNAQTCAVVAQTNALRLSGQRFLITVRELAQRAGLNLQTIAASGRQAGDYQRMLTAMRQMGVPARELVPAQRTFESLFQSLRRAGKGVATVSGRYGANGVGGHRLYAYIGRAGNLIIRDPARGRILRSAEAIYQAFGNNTFLSNSEVLFVPNALVVQASHLAQGLSEIAISAETLALRVLPVVPVRAQDSQTALQVLRLREAIAAKAPPQAAQKIHIVRPGDNLWKLAQVNYGHGSKAALIYEANRKTIGPDWNLIKPGQELLIPPLPPGHAH